MHTTDLWRVLRWLVAIAAVIVAIPVSPANAGVARTPVWVGAPLAGIWPTADRCAGAAYPSASCSLPSAHHTFRWSNAYPGDWGYDQQRVTAGAAVRLYAAPQNTAYNNQIIARVQSVRTACAPRSGESTAATLSRGGRAITVAIFHNTTKIGTVTFVHVDSGLSAGQTISRWGSQVGTIGRYTSNSCWTGVHLHAELYNESNYACYNKGWRPGQTMNAANFIGYLGGAFASAPRRPCP